MNPLENLSVANMVRKIQHWGKLGGLVSLPPSLNMEPENGRPRGVEKAMPSMEIISGGLDFPNFHVERPTATSKMPTCTS